jgi:uncharacterized protein YpiB (UPF0302 family)
MKKLSGRSFVAVAMVTGLFLATPLAASAGTERSKTSSARTYHQEIVAYRESRLAIQLAFQSAVNTARANFVEARAIATTSAQRSAAQQALTTAIIQAASERSSALTNLGAPPVRAGA